MSGLSKTRWAVTWLVLGILKRVLANRVKGENNEQWIQHPASNNPHIFNRVDFILEACKNKNVLHTGFSDYPFTTQKLKNKNLLHQSLKQAAARVLGVDNDLNSINEYKTITGDNGVYYCDILQSYPPEILKEPFDIILLSEVLEHIENPAKALEILHNNFPSGCKVLVTVPNYASIDCMAASLNKTESIHPDHYWYFSPYTLCKLFNKEMFYLQELHFGMYYQKNTKINSVMKQFPYNGDCIIAIFTIKK